MGRPVRAKTAPGTPLRSPLTESLDNGNSASSSSPSPSQDDGLLDQTKDRSPPPFLKPTTRNLLPRKHNFDSFVSSTSSPLKRSDTIFSLDQASLASPVAKRRSIHGAYASTDFKIFDDSPTEESTFGPGTDLPLTIRSDANQDDSAIPGTPSVPDRSSSLRLSTLQQRHPDRPSFIRSRPGAPEVAFEFTAPGFSASQIRSRNALDSFAPPARRDSPFPHSGQLANASIHVFNPLHRPQAAIGSQPLQHPHPLSRTMTASSHSSTELDSPTHPPLRLTSRSLRIDFSKSLPIGATRPSPYSTSSSQVEPQSGQELQSSYITPQSYKFAKPLPAAFMSTGLISKKNRDLVSPEHENGLAHASMPDTPCKRPTGSFPEVAEDKLDCGAVQVASEHRHSFGTPSTPYNPNLAKHTPQTFGKGVSIFGSSYLQNRLNRSDSFTSIDALEAGASPPGLESSQTFPEHELPPTPTKPNPITATIPQGPAFNIFGQRSPESRPEPVCGFTTWPIRSNTSPLDQTKAYNRRRPITPRALQISLDTVPLSLPPFASQPHPQDKRVIQSAGSIPPSTPTGSRTFFSTSRARRSSITPITSFTTAELDECLTERFTKVELIGTGQFSQVYRVSEIPPPSSRMFGSQSTTPGLHGQPLCSDSPCTPPAERVFAVKKSRKPYVGQRDRALKLQEVHLLRRLDQNDHVVNFIDSWEMHSHLYIQTEYCEEGSLDLFLAGVGRKARLDDFRTWKVLLELGLVSPLNSLYHWKSH